MYVSSDAQQAYDKQGFSLQYSLGWWHECHCKPINPGFAYSIQGHSKSSKSIHSSTNRIGYCMIRHDQGMGASAPLLFSFASSRPELRPWSRRSTDRCGSSVKIIGQSEIRTHTLRWILGYVSRTFVDCLYALLASYSYDKSHTYKLCKSCSYTYSNIYNRI